MLIQEVFEKTMPVTVHFLALLSCADVLNDLAVTLSFFLTQASLLTLDPGS